MGGQHQQLGDDISSSKFDDDPDQHDNSAPNGDDISSSKFDVDPDQHDNSGPKCNGGDNGSVVGGQQRGDGGHHQYRGDQYQQESKFNGTGGDGGHCYDPEFIYIPSKPKDTDIKGAKVFYNFIDYNII